MMNYSVTGEPLDTLDELLLELQSVSGPITCVLRLVCSRRRRRLRKPSMDQRCAPYQQVLQSTAGYGCSCAGDFVAPSPKYRRHCDQPQSCEPMLEEMALLDVHWRT